MNTEAMISSATAKKETRRPRYRSPIFLCLATLAITLLTAIGHSQTTTSTIEGTVRDANGALIAGAQVKAASTTLATERTVITDAEGRYRIVSLPAGVYTLTVSQSGFANNVSQLELSLNRTATVDVQLEVGTVGGDVVNVANDLPLLTTDSSATGTTVTPQQIRDLPVSGRNYTDLLQLVPGTAINRQADPEGDNANPVLGERSGNNNFFIDGHPNKDSVSGGPAAQFNQETIAEFQVLTTGYKAEFGQASGAIVNVITKSGGNTFRGVTSLFHRNEALDSTNNPERTTPTYLRRFDFSAALSGPIWRDKVFFFASAERISENREIDFRYPPFSNAVLDQLIRNLESDYDYPSPYRETRFFTKLNQQFGRHSLSQEVNYTNGNIKNFGALSAGNSLPSTRTDRGSRSLLLAFGDTMLLGDQAEPWIVTLRGAYRGEPSDIGPTHQTGGGSTLIPYETPVLQPLQIPGPLRTANFGNNQSYSFLDQKYTTLTANANKRLGRHDIKFGWNFIRTKVDGVDARTLANQLYTTVDDFIAFSPAVAGIRLLADSGGAVPQDDQLRLRNNYNAVFVQDELRIRNNLTLNLGLRWDKDSEFDANMNFAPRLGVTWGITTKTVLRAQIGRFYDQFRLGIARNVPQFGGAKQVTGQVLIFPRGLYGSPNFVSSIALLLLGSGPCFSNVSANNATDAQIISSGATCPFNPAQAFIGVDRLNNIVATGRSPIPANSVITIDNIQNLSGLNASEYLSRANAAIGFPGFFTFGPTGLLTNQIIPPFGAPDTLENTDETPNTIGFSIGLQREVFKGMVFEADYHHRKMKNILGVRQSNLAFVSRLPGRNRTYDTPGTPVVSFGPYYEGTYDALVVALSKRLSDRYTFGVNYTFANQTDNSRGANLTPSDNFIGIVPEVTETATGKSNRGAPFIAANGNFVAQAGTFWNGPDVDKGSSDLSVDHIFQINGMVELPWKFQFSGILRAQSGFHYSKTFSGFIDPDGDGNTNGIDTRNHARNEFTAPVSSIWICGSLNALNLATGSKSTFSTKYSTFSIGRIQRLLIRSPLRIFSER